MPDSFVHLHVHTEYSMLDGAVRIGALMNRVKELGMPAVAMTDHGNLFGAINFYQKAKAAGVKPIIGCEVYLAPGSMHEKKKIPGRKTSHLTLLSQNFTGYQNLVKLVSLAHLDGMYYKPRIDKELLAKHSEGLICLSGCLNSEINQYLQVGQVAQARQSLGQFRDIFGKERFFLEMHDHKMPEQAKCNAELVKFRKEFDLGLVAANDVHFLTRGDHEAHDALICIGTGSNLHDERRLHYSTEVYLKTPQEMAGIFPDYPEALQNTLRIAEMCDLELTLDSTSSERYPQYEPPEGKTRSQYLRELCWSGLDDRYGKERAATDEVLRQRLEYELGILEQMGFISYFLIVWDFIHWARMQDIPVGPGRGSAAGSLVAYVLGIVDLCPLRFGLIFERFLNPERVSPPDVDIDFCQTRRPEVIEYVRQKYGERSVSHIITYGTMGAKSVIRDVGRVMGMSYGEADKISKMVPTELKMTLAKARSQNEELNGLIEENPKVRQLWDYSTFLEGLNRGTGIHAAGVVISDRDLTEFIPLCRGKEGEVVTQYDMGPLTDLGMLKMDFLGLKTLTVIQGAVDLIREKVPDFTIGTISQEDQATFDLLNAGETCGVFQLESGGMVNLCKQFGVDRIEDIIALIALYRPGPMDLIPDYIARKRGQKKIRYEHPLLEDVCSETYGIMIYQEQVQKAANVLAGYSLGDADLLRRAMGKKKLEEMAKQRARFIKGAFETNKIPEKKANAIFDLLEKFAGYGFNKSHSAAYGLISYQTAFLKANYPVEFMSSVLSNEINNTEKISVFVAECQRMGIPILPPDVNRSNVVFAPERPRKGEEAVRAIRFGLAAVKNVGGVPMKAALKEREKADDFETIDNFSTRLDSHSVNRKILESLIRAGAFDFSGETRASMFQRVDKILASAAAEQKDRKSGQVSLFDAMEFAPPKPKSPEEQVPEWEQERRLADEKELLGFYVTGHPLDPYKKAIQTGKFASLGNLEETVEKRTSLNFAGLVQECTVKYSKKDNKPFAILLFEDFTGHREIMVWSETYAKSKDALEKGSVVQINATVDNRSEEIRITANEVKGFHLKKNKVARERITQPVVAVVDVYLDSQRHTTDDLHNIHDTLLEHRGNIPLRLAVRLPDGRTVILRAANRFLTDGSQELLDKLAAWREKPRRRRAS